MKKILVFLLVGMIGLPLTGCGNSTKDLALYVCDDYKYFEVTLDDLQDIIERDFQEFMENKTLTFETLNSENKALMKDNLYIIADVKDEDARVRSIKFLLDPIDKDDIEAAGTQMQQIITTAAAVLKDKEAASSVLETIMKEFKSGADDNEEVQGHAVADHIMFTLYLATDGSNKTYSYLLLEPSEFADQKAYMEAVEDLLKEIDQNVADLEASPTEAALESLEKRIELYHKPYYKERYDGWVSRIEVVKAAIEESKISVMDFGTMSKEDADAWCSANGIKCTITAEYSDSTAEGSLLSQSIEPDNKLNAGDTIKIVYSKGKQPTTEYLNAQKKAESYSKNMHMSKQAIYDQLTSEYGEKFPADAAQYAIDHMYADWNANALAKAKSYQKNMSMSASAIYDQLVSAYGEQFTCEEAQYAIDHLND